MLDHGELHASCRARGPARQLRHDPGRDVVGDRHPRRRSATATSCRSRRSARSSAASPPCMGVAMLALPVGIVATAFADVIHRRDSSSPGAWSPRCRCSRNLDATSIAEIMQLLHSRIPRDGRLVARRGEQADAMYFIVRGEVEVELMDADNVRLGATATSSARSRSCTGDVRNATVRATRDTQLLVLAGARPRAPDGPGTGDRQAHPRVGHNRAPHRVEAEAEAELRRRRERKPGPQRDAEGAASMLSRDPDAGARPAAAATPPASPPPSSRPAGRRARRRPAAGSRCHTGSPA